MGLRRALLIHAMAIVIMGVLGDGNQLLHMGAVYPFEIGPNDSQFFDVQIPFWSSTTITRPIFITVVCNPYIELQVTVTAQSESFHQAWVGVLRKEDIDVTIPALQPPAPQNVTINITNPSPTHVQYSINPEYLPITQEMSGLEYVTLGVIQTFQKRWFSVTVPANARFQIIAERCDAPSGDPNSNVLYLTVAPLGQSSLELVDSAFSCANVRTTASSVITLPPEGEHEPSPRAQRILVCPARALILGRDVASEAGGDSYSISMFLSASEVSFGSSVNVTFRLVAWYAAFPPFTFPTNPVSLQLTPLVLEGDTNSDLVLSFPLVKSTYPPNSVFAITSVGILNSSYITLLRQYNLLGMSCFIDNNLKQLQYSPSLLSPLSLGDEGGSVSLLEFPVEEASDEGVQVTIYLYYAGAIFFVFDPITLPAPSVTVKLLPQRAWTRLATVVVAFMAVALFLTVMVNIILLCRREKEYVSIPEEDLHMIQDVVTM